MRSKLRFLFQRLGEQLWLRPLAFCVVALLAAFAASLADRLDLEGFFPRMEHDTVEQLLSIIAASMLGVATFAVGSMVAAYASVSSSATPRAFTLVISDDVSKTALSTFVAAFIFSVIALIAIKSDSYGRAGLFVVFAMTLFVLGAVVFTFIRWVDQIARLGRLGTTIARVERAAEAAIVQRHRAPRLGGVPVVSDPAGGEPIYAERVGYVQYVDVAALQACAVKHRCVLTVAAMPGAFAAPGRALAFARSVDPATPLDRAAVVEAFTLGHDRVFEEDPRFGLIALSEIAGRALSPAVNDPGTAIGIVGTFVRLFALWVSPVEEAETAAYDRVEVPLLSVEEMFDDAFTAIARDGAGAVEVGVRLQKSFRSLVAVGDPELAKVARRHSRLALARAERSLTLPEDLERVRALAGKVLSAA